MSGILRGHLDWKTYKLSSNEKDHSNNWGNLVMLLQAQNMYLKLHCILLSVKTIWVIGTLLLVKESQSDKKSDSDADCAEHDVGCWSQKWSARQGYNCSYKLLADTVLLTFLTWNSFFTVVFKLQWTSYTVLVSTLYFSNVCNLK